MSDNPCEIPSENDKCPICGNNDFQPPTRFPTFDENVVFADVTCTRCGCKYSICYEVKDKYIDDTDEKTRLFLQQFLRNEPCESCGSKRHHYQDCENCRKNEVTCNVLICIDCGAEIFDRKVK